jgi:dihydrofolate reductase
MSKVFFDVGITIDGFIAGSNAGVNNPLGDKGIQIHNWMFKQKSFRNHIKLEGGETNNVDNDIIETIFNRIGANIMGKKMFIEGEANWPEEAPFHCPVFVLTKEKREPWVRPGGTTFYFTNENIHSVLKRAKEAAGDKDVRISGGANVIMQYFNAGLIDEFTLHVAPMIMGNGVLLFEKIKTTDFNIEISTVVNSPSVTHLYYNIKHKG